MYLQMNQTTNFASISIVPTSLTNNDMINVSLVINFPLNFPSSGILTVVFPSILDLTSSSCDTNCKISNSFRYNYSSSISSYNFTISNIKNGPSFQPIPNFIISLVN
jgi:hypothetical protein